MGEASDRRDLRMEFIELLITICAIYTTFSLFSILLGFDTPFFALAEHIYVGVAIGFMVISATNYLQNQVLAKLTADVVTNWPLIIGAILGIMMLGRLSSKTSYLARVPMTIATGVGVALTARTTIFTSIITNLVATIKPIVGDASMMDKFTNLAMLVMVLFILTFYLYTTKLTGPLQTSHNIGRYILYAAFGALFAQTYMGRLGLFLGRMEGMLFPALNAQISAVVVVIILGGSFYLKKYAPDLLKKLTPD